MTEFPQWRMNLEFIVMRSSGQARGWHKAVGGIFSSGILEFLVYKRKKPLGILKFPILNTPKNMQLSSFCLIYAYDIKKHRTQAGHRTSCYNDIYHNSPSSCCNFMIFLWSKITLMPISTTPIIDTAVSHSGTLTTPPAAPKTNPQSAIKVVSILPW